MRKIILLGLSVLSLSVFSTNLFANPAEGSCEAQKADGVTKGLFGLCVAFHASGGDRGKILEKYNQKKLPGDPDLIPSEKCACWSATQISNAAAAYLADPQGNDPICYDDGYGLYLVFGNTAFAAGDLLYTGASECSYDYAYPTDADGTEQVCRDDINTTAVELGTACF